MVYSLSRLGRSTRDILNISDLLQVRKADLVSCLNNSTPPPPPASSCLACWPCWQSLNAVWFPERTKMALAQKKATGEVYSPIPYGFREVEGRLVRVSKEAGVVAEILRKRGQDNPMTP